jgi:hypothetical protein
VAKNGATEALDGADVGASVRANVSADIVDIMERLIRPEVRDLAGVLAAPGLLATPSPLGAAPDLALSDGECAQMLDAHRAALGALDRDPAELAAWLAAGDPSHLLGRYFEGLVGYWIRHLLGARRFAQSIKALNGRQVVGELDFVFEDGSGQLQHWESSVKFYLCAAETPEGGRRADSFLGTMTRDRLDKKLARLFDRQLGMPATSEGKEALRAAGFGDALLKSRLLMKGALFYPLERDWRTHPHPPEVSPAHLRGWWSRVLAPGEAWVVLGRRRWLSPFFAPAADEGFAPLSRAELEARVAAHFAESRTAFMVAAVERGAEGAWREAHRGLVVHPGWPWRVIE